MRPLTPRITSSRACAILAAGLVCLALPCSAVSPAKLSGGLAGLVRDGVGVPQMGATVLLFNHEDRLFARALTDEKGGFSFLSLIPDVYSIRVSLRSFVPVFRDNVVVQPGVRSILNVNLTTLFSTIQLVTPPPGERALMSDDWKWVLRSASATRPILRILPNFDPNFDPDHPRRGTAVFSETRGLVKLSGGDGGQVTGYGNEADLGTAFAFATSLFGNNQVAVSGNLGYTAQSGMATAGFRTSYTRDLGGISPVVSLTMREMVVPRLTEAMAGGPGAMGDLPPLRTMSVSLGDQAQLSEALQLQYGFSLDSVSFLDRLHYFSPYAQLNYELPDSSKIDLSYTSGNARPELGANQATLDSELQRDINALSLVPRISLRDGRAKVQRGEDLEIGYSRKEGSRTYRVSGYRERVTNAALTIVAPGGLYIGGDILPDLFSSSSIFDAGNYQTLGYTASVTQNLGDNFKVTAMYGSVGVLVPQSDQLSTDNPEELRSLIHASRRNAVTARGSGTVPRIGTHFIASYQWMDQVAVTPAHMYSTQSVRPEPGLNLYVRQPIPTFFSLPWRMEASADLRNLLAQGYLPMSFADGRRLLLVQTPRSFRGGLSFIF
jgi:Carboxypeptidase regulatory-like domain